MCAHHYIFLILIPTCRHCCKIEHSLFSQYPIIIKYPESQMICQKFLRHKIVGCPSNYASISCVSQLPNHSLWSYFYGSWVSHKLNSSILWCLHILPLQKAASINLKWKNRNESAMGKVPSKRNNWTKDVDWTITE